MGGGYAPVAKHIFNESLRTFLRKKTVVLATHQLQFLRHASRVLVVDRDSPAAFGSLQEVMQSEAFSVVNYSKEAFEDATTATEATTTDAEGSKTRDSSSRQRSRQAGRSESGRAHSKSASSGSSGSPSGSQKSAASELPTAEEREQRLIRASSQASSNLNESVKVLTPSALESSLAGAEPDDGQPPKAKRRAKAKAAGQAAAAASESGTRRQGTETLSAVSSNFSTYVYYLSSATGSIMFVWFLLINFAAQGLYQYLDFYLSFWTDSVQRKEYQGVEFVPQTFVDELSIGEMASIYGILIGLLFVATFCRSATFFWGTIRASINIHNKLFASIIQAPMSFFDFSPIGILLNRLSRDVGFVDETLPQTAIDIITIFVNIGGIIVLAIILDLNNLFASIGLFAMAFLLRSLCARTITRLKQIEGVTRSPIFTHLSTTLSGLATIRAFRVQEEFVRMFDKYQDTHTSAWFGYISSGRWLAVSMDWLCLSFIGLVITLLLAFSLDSTNASFIGLLISQVVILPGPFQWGMRQLIEMESQMTSVQRIKESSELRTEQELMRAFERAGGHEEDEETGRLLCSSQSSAASSSSASLGSSASGARRASRQTRESLAAHSYQSGRLETPTNEGQVRFVDVSLHYFADEPAVLRSLSFTVRPYEKVGIVGRTGAGKSSIVSVLFRLYPFEGHIELDGVDTKSMSLTELRRSMSIIPQEPVLFGGSLRKNLDPFAEHADTELWSALEAVQLRHLFARHPAGLDFQIQEGGSNFSVGQRQLVCLARAIVRRNKLLVLDEATANVDPETDSFIQRTIARQFAQCTVLTIAHRLITIVDSDRVLVLDRGEMREFGEPYELLQQNGLFAQMVASSAQQAPRIRKLIEEAHRRRAPSPSGSANSQEAS